MKQCFMNKERHGAFPMGNQTRIKENKMKKIAGILLGMGLAVAAHATVIVDFQHDSGSTTPDSVADDVTATAALGGSLSSVAIATSIDQLSAGIGTNIADDNYNNYFTYTLVNDTEITFDSLDIDAAAKVLTRDYRISYTIGTGTEIFINEWTDVDRNITGTDGSVNYDFADFTTTEDVTFTVYWSGTSTDTTLGRVYVDDFVLNGTVIPEPATIGLLGLGSLALLAFRRRIK
jgi:hypothetical protein